jgi:hypothetical protein
MNMVHIIDAPAANPTAAAPKKGRKLCSLTFCKPESSASEIDEAREEVKKDDISDLASVLRELISEGLIKEDHVLVLADGREITYGQLLEIAEKRKKLPKKNEESVSDALQGAASVQLMEAKKQIITLLLKELSRFNTERKQFPSAQQKLFLKNFINFLKNDDLITQDQKNSFLTLLENGKIEEVASGIQISLEGKQATLDSKIQKEKTKLSQIKHIPPVISGRGVGRFSVSLLPPTSSEIIKKTETNTLSSHQEKLLKTEPITDESKEIFAKYLKQLIDTLEKLDAAKKSVALKTEEEDRIESEHKKQEANKVRRICQEIGLPENYLQIELAQLEDYSMDSLRALALSVKRQFKEELA